MYPEPRRDTGTILMILVAVLLVVGGLIYATHRGLITEADPATADGAAVTAAATVTVPLGTELEVEFVESVSSDTHASGDEFTAVVVEEVTKDGQVAVRAGDTVVGTIVEAVPSESGDGAASLNLEFKAIRLASGEEVPLSARFLLAEREPERPSQTAGSAGDDVAAKDAGAAARGAILGRLVGRHPGDEGGDGTPIGDAVAAPYGTAIVAADAGAPVVIPGGTVFGLRVELPLQVPVPARTEPPRA